MNEIATTTDDTYDFPHPQHAKSAIGPSHSLSRQMARRKPKRGQPASNGYRRAKKDAAKTYRMAARQDDSRNCAKSPALNHDQIAMEDFKAKFLAKTTMAKKRADAAIGSAKGGGGVYG